MDEQQQQLKVEMLNMRIFRRARILHFLVLGTSVLLLMMVISAPVAGQDGSGEVEMVGEQGPETTDKPSTGFDPPDGFRLASTSTRSELLINPQSGKLHQLKMTTRTYVPSDYNDLATLASCTVSYTHSAPARSGGIYVLFAFSQGSVSVSSGCSGGVNATLRLRMKSGGGSWATKDTHSRFVGRGLTRNFYVSKDCVNTSTRFWLARFDGQTSTIQSVACTA